MVRRYLLLLSVVTTSLFGGNGPFGLAYHFNDTTYVVVTDESLISNLYRQTTNTSYSLDDKSEPIRLEIEKTEHRKKLSLYYDSWGGIDLIPITGSRTALKKSIKMWPGRKLNCEVLSKQNEITSIPLEIDRIYLHQIESSSFVVATCTNHAETFLIKDNFARCFVNLSMLPPKKQTLGPPQDSTIPTIVMHSFEDLQEKLIPLETRDNPIDKFNSKIMVLSHTDYKGEITTNYIGAFSYGSKGSTGYLTLINPAGEILSVKPGYRGLMGVVDIDQDGCGEVVTFYNLGDYASAIEIFAIHKRAGVHYLESLGRKYAELGG